MINVVMSAILRIICLMGKEKSICQIKLFWKDSGLMDIANSLEPFKNSDDDR